MIAVAHATRGWTATFHAVGNWLYYFFGVSGSGPHYGFWSGSGSDIGEVTVVGGVLVLVRHLNCHEGGNFPFGCKRLRTHPVEGTPFRACRKHHPVLSKHPRRITAAIMAKAHEDAHALRGEESRKLDEIHRHVTALAPNVGDFPPSP